MSGIKPGEFNIHCSLVGSSLNAFIDSYSCPCWCSLTSNSVRFLCPSGGQLSWSSPFDHGPYKIMGVQGSSMVMYWFMNASVPTVLSMNETCALLARYWTFHNECSTLDIPLAMTQLTHIVKWNLEITVILVHVHWGIVCIYFSVDIHVWTLDNL